MKGGYPPALQVTSFSAQDPGVRVARHAGCGDGDSFSRSRQCS